MRNPSEDTRQLQAEELHDALAEFARLYQFRDRDRICCHDVSVTQCYALEVLSKRAECTLNELAAELCLEKSTASRVVATLERKGYIARSGHPRDGRAILLRATSAGRRLYARIRTGLVEEKQRLLRLLNEYIDGPGLTVVIGAEHPDPNLRSFSLIASTYEDGSGTGTVGVIGPTRMRYSRAIDVVDGAAQAVSRVLRDPN